jgi:hypothetical protein
MPVQAGEVSYAVGTLWSAPEARAWEGFVARLARNQEIQQFLSASGFEE